MGFKMFLSHKNHKLYKNHEWFSTDPDIKRCWICGRVEIKEYLSKEQLAERNKQNVKYPVPVLASNSGATYGVLSPAHSEQPVYNVARPRGFFSGTTTSAGFSAITSAGYVLSSNWCYPVSSMTGGTMMWLSSGATQCSTQDYWPVAGDLIMVQYIEYKMVFKEF